MRTFTPINGMSSKPGVIGSYVQIEAYEKLVSEVAKTKAELEVAMRLIRKIGEVEDAGMRAIRLNAKGVDDYNRKAYGNEQGRKTNKEANNE